MPTKEGLGLPIKPVKVTGPAVEACKRGDTEMASEAARVVRAAWAVGLKFAANK